MNKLEKFKREYMNRRYEIRTKIIKELRKIKVGDSFIIPQIRRKVDISSTRISNYLSYLIRKGFIEREHYGLYVKIKEIGDLR